jgi:DNA-binding LytR/AlgR family response regulator
VDEALEMLHESLPDLVFLDIHMPDKDGFHFIEKAHLEGLRPGIVFVTAYEHYAIQAIRNSVFDYILKPVRSQDLTRAVDRFRERTIGHHQKDIDQLLAILKQSAPAKVKLNTRSGYILIDPREVVFCQADGNYTHIQMAGGNKELTSQNLGSIEELLEGSTFFRASRSYLLNLRYLSKVDRKNSSCILEYNGESHAIRIPSQKIKILEATFS